MLSQKQTSAATHRNGRKLSFLTWIPFQPLNSEESMPNVVIVGAGLAGLAAAQRLRQLGFDVLLLEARNRIGGRVHTQFCGETPVELGAQWIEGVADHPLRPICQQLALPEMEADGDSLFIYDEEAKPYPLYVAEQWWGEVESQVEATEAIYHSRRAEHLPDISVAHALIPRELSDVQPAFSTQAKERFRNWAIAWNCEANESENIDRLSLFASWDNSQAAIEWVREDSFCIAGLDRIVTHLAEGLEIRLNEQVLRVQHNDSQVTLVTKRTQYVADEVILTLPLGVLKRAAIEFTPPFSLEKQTAIERLGVGSVHKVVLHYDQVFWPDDVHYFGYADTQPGRFVEWRSLSYYHGQPILVLWSHGQAARELEQQTPEEIIAAADRLVRSTFAGTDVSLVEGKVSGWQHDPFSEGAYSYFAVGSSLQDIRALAAPEGKLGFAGEATHQRYPATMQGAYLSGLREADRIARKLQHYRPTS